MSGKTGLWYSPRLIIVGPFIWIFKTQGALNRFWESKGAPGKRSPARGREPLRP